MIPDVHYNGSACVGCGAITLSMVDLQGKDGYAGTVRICRLCYCKWLKANGALRLRGGRVLITCEDGDTYIASHIERLYSKAISLKAWNMHLRYLRGGGR